MTVSKQCTDCGNIFLEGPKGRHKRCGKCRNKHGTVGCPECGANMRRASKTCKACYSTSLLNEGSPTWKGGRHITRYGYVLVLNPERTALDRGSKRYMPEHRLVVEQNIGRKLFAHENVHHINGIRDDNRLENLEIWSTSQPSGQRVDDKLKWATMYLEQYGYKVYAP